MILTELVDHYGWDEMYCMLHVNCFLIDPSMKSSLKFFRKNEWARTKLEEIYLDFLRG